jgi:hypothetical protein
MSSRPLLSRQCRRLFALAAAAAALQGLAARPSLADDRGLLRFDSAKPYLFILFDDSGSMASVPGDTLAAANGDDPASKLFSAKQVAYNVFSAATDVQFGFASFNQDNLRVRGKHWLYTAATGTSAAVSKLPVAWPADGEQWVFGTFFPVGTQDVSGKLAVVTPGTLGSPIAGLSLATYTTQLDRFAKLQDNDDNSNHLVDDSDSSQSTVLYLTAKGSTYQYTISRAANTPNLGDAALTVQITEKLCSAGICNGVASTANLTFNLVSAFLMLEGPATQASKSVDNQTGRTGKGSPTSSSPAVASRATTTARSPASRCPRAACSSAASTPRPTVTTPTAPASAANRRTPSTATARRCAPRT